jgi:signal transduction histidine kinase
LDVFNFKLYNVYLICHWLYMQQTEIISFIIVSGILLFVFVLGIVAFVLQYRKKRVEHENEKVMINVKHNEELLSTQLEMQQQTMQHIGREIHDNVGQKLTLASLYTQQLSFENKAPQINDKIENISSILNESLQELRRLSKTLIDDTIAEKNIVQLLKQECDNIEALKYCAVQYTYFENNITLSYQQKNVVLRIVQEFLQNSIKHSKCKNIKVSIQQENDFVKLQIQDDGIGFEIENTVGKGIGLKNIAKRIQLLDGTFNLTSNLLKGTILQINIPIQHEA